MIIHLAHVCTILEAPLLRNGSGEELRHIHDVVKQHMRVLMAIKYDSLVAFMSLVIELKLDQSSMFAWQNQSGDHKKVPPYTALLEVLDLRAWTSENVTRKDDWKWNTSTHEPKTFAKLYVSEVQDSCVMCKGKHQLHKCKDFCTMPYEWKWPLLKGTPCVWTAWDQDNFLRIVPPSKQGVP